jgi:hypothetical protein
MAQMSLSPMIIAITMALAMPALMTFRLFTAMAQLVVLRPMSSLLQLPGQGLAETII